MKEVLAVSLVFLLCSCTKEPNVAVRIDCGDYNDKGLQATINGKSVGDCPIDMMVHAGDLTATARKDSEDASYLYGEAKMTLAENAMKRIKLDVQPVYTEEYYYRKATDLSGMELYLEKQPDGKHKNEVAEKLEQYYFENAIDMAGMEQYLKKKPEGKNKEQILQALAKEMANLNNFAPGLLMVKIPAGTFKMGDLSGKGSSDEKPVRTVTIRSFAMGKHEVTFAQYDVFAKATKRALPKDEGWGRDKRPVINVSWEDAMAYTKWLSQQTGQRFRLPTETEWEYAARAGTTSEYSWGNGIDCKNAKYGHENCGAAKTLVVGSYAANAFGLQDMHGNVWEWVQDCYVNTYKEAPLDGSAVISDKCDSRVLRGGSWPNVPNDLRSAYRGYNGPSSRGNDYGFRLVQDL